MRADALLLALLALGLAGAAPPPPPPRRGRMSIAQLRQLAAQAGFPDPVVAAAVAMAESLGVPSATNIVTHPAPGNLPERSFGLWQINTLASPQYDETRLLDPAYNAAAAFALSKGGRDWSHWSTYTSGKYRQYLGG